jgi:hypothetical protein
LRRRFAFQESGEWPVTYNLHDWVSPGLSQEIERHARELEEITPAVGHVSGVA